MRSETCSRALSVARRTCRAHPAPQPGRVGQTTASVAIRTTSYLDAVEWFAAGGAAGVAGVGPTLTARFPVIADAKLRFHSGQLRTRAVASSSDFLSHPRSVSMGVPQLKVSCADAIFAFSSDPIQSSASK